MKRVEAIGRQGDVHFFKIDSFPEGERTIDHQCKKGVLAYGEVTGHAHQIIDGSFELFRIMNEACRKVLFLDVKKKVVIEHGREKEFTGVEPDQDYHEKVILDPGKYMTGIVEEVDHLSGVIRKVAD